VEAPGSILTKKSQALNSQNLQRQTKAKVARVEAPSSVPKKRAKHGTHKTHDDKQPTEQKTHFKRQQMQKERQQIQGEGSQEKRKSKRNKREKKKRPGNEGLLH